ncbi:hypothetical protein QT711_11430 [Sporosarcina saromensis]|uniref:Fur-regulated basic protein A n=1 Tax=Sporosarcina saromensis TaxID=359365 RepID=A0ABU4G9Z0_9BACL|nr:hypothetical protein [Sporosarcina saromensis]MDW0113799.1 hypothetical protein [Sporosarcina saromensis]
MIGRKVNHSRETEKQIIIRDLNKLGVYETVKGEPLQKESYYTLLSMLAVEQAVAQ